MKLISPFSSLVKNKINNRFKNDEISNFNIVFYKETQRCLHNRLRKISLQHFKRRIPFQAAVGLHSIVEIHKAAQLFSPMLRAIKLLFVVPHFHRGCTR